MNMFCFKPFHCSPDFMFRVVVVLEGEPLTQSQVYCRLQQVIFQDCFVFVTMGLLAASLISAISVWLVSLGGRCWDPAMDFNIKLRYRLFWNFQNKLHLTDFQQLREVG
ncbi:hypothetical protein ATANTOWER_028420 [Ataeniobius toweri]|uniref:Uncharacterized protein n=1 Tax=Ataeniobius toweri TaxID=208326 RepID=A0ABU7BIL4_9TELE|nr:hypothetical protein [Ataeniobius toweri]